MKKLLFIIIHVLLLHEISAQTFTQFITQVNSSDKIVKQNVIDSFMTATKQFPITEDSLAHFIYQGVGNKVSIGGDFNNWNPRNGQMTNVIGTNLWHRTEIFKNNSRLEYKIVIDETSWILDELNTLSSKGGFGVNSEIRMPKFISPEEIKYFSNILHGTIKDTVLFSKQLDNTRKITIYLPPKYSESNDFYPVILVHDGEEYLRIAKMNNILDFLISRKMIQPVIAVFVPGVNRSAEYLDKDVKRYTTFIIEEVMQMVDSKFRTKELPDDRLVMGSSAGANIALWIAMNHFDSFGNVGAFSPYIKADIIEHFQNSKKMNLKLFILHGSYDHLPQIHSSVNNFTKVLDNKSYKYNYLELPESHNYGFWRAYIDDLLIYSFPYDPTSY